MDIDIQTEDLSLIWYKSLQRQQLFVYNDIASWYYGKKKIKQYYDSY